jgi:excisionase family DNA binding protein
MTEKQFMTPEEFATFLRVHINTVYKLIEKGEIAYVHTGTGQRAHIRIPVKWVEEHYGEIN